MKRTYDRTVYDESLARLERSGLISARTKSGDPVFKAFTTLLLSIGAVLGGLIATMES